MADLFGDNPFTSGSSMARSRPSLFGEETSVDPAKAREVIGYDRSVIENIFRAITRPYWTISSIVAGDPEAALRHAGALFSQATNPFTVFDPDLSVGNVTGLWEGEWTTPEQEWEGSELAQKYGLAGDPKYMTWGQRFLWDVVPGILLDPLTYMSGAGAGRALLAKGFGGLSKATPRVAGSRIRSAMTSKALAGGIEDGRRMAPNVTAPSLSLEQQIVKQSESLLRTMDTGIGKLRAAAQYGQPVGSESLALANKLENSLQYQRLTETVATGRVPKTKSGLGYMARLQKDVAAREIAWGLVEAGNPRAAATITKHFNQGEDALSEAIKLLAEKGAITDPASMYWSVPFITNPVKTAEIPFVGKAISAGTDALGQVGILPGESFWGRVGRTTIPGRMDYHLDKANLLNPTREMVGQRYQRIVDWANATFINRYAYMGAQVSSQIQDAALAAEREGQSFKREVTADIHRLVKGTFTQEDSRHMGGILDNYDDQITRTFADRTSTAKLRRMGDADLKALAQQRGVYNPRHSKKQRIEELSKTVDNPLVASQVAKVTEVEGFVKEFENAFPNGAKDFTNLNPNKQQGLEAAVRSMLDSDNLQLLYDAADQISGLNVGVAQVAPGTRVILSKLNTGQQERLVKVANALRASGYRSGSPAGPLLPPPPVPPTPYYGHPQPPVPPPPPLPGNPPPPVPPPGPNITVTPKNPTPTPTPPPGGGAGRISDPATRAALDARLRAQTGGPAQTRRSSPRGVDSLTPGRVPRSSGPRPVDAIDQTPAPKLPPGGSRPRPLDVTRERPVMGGRTTPRPVDNIDQAPVPRGGQPPVRPQPTTYPPGPQITPTPRPPTPRPPTPPPPVPPPVPPYFDVTQFSMLDYHDVKTGLNFFAKSQARQLQWWKKQMRTNVEEGVYKAVIRDAIANPQILPNLTGAAREAKIKEGYDLHRKIQTRIAKENKELQAWKIPGAHASATYIPRQVSPMFSRLQIRAMDDEELARALNLLQKKDVFSRSRKTLDNAEFIDTLQDIFGTELNRNQGFNRAVQQVLNNAGVNPQTPAEKLQALMRALADKYNVDVDGLDNLAKETDLFGLLERRAYAHSRTRGHYKVWNTAKRVGAVTDEFNMDPAVRDYLNHVWSPVIRSSKDLPALVKIFSGGEFETPLDDMSQANRQWYEDMAQTYEREGPTGALPGRRWLNQKYKKDFKTGKESIVWRFPGLNPTWKAMLTSAPVNVKFHSRNNVSALLMAHLDSVLAQSVTGKEKMDALWGSFFDGAIVKMVPALIRRTRIDKIPGVRTGVVKARRAAGLTDELRPWGTNTLRVQNEASQSQITGHFVRFITSPPHEAQDSLDWLKNFSGLPGLGDHSWDEIASILRQTLGPQIDNIGNSSTRADLLRRMGDSELYADMASEGPRLLRGIRRYFELGHEVAELNEARWRVTATLAGIRDGLPEDEIVNRVQKAFVDYSVNSEVEFILRQFLPFAKFTIGSSRWAKEMAQRPRLLTPFARARGEDEGEFLPESVADSIALPVPWKDADGNREYLTNLGLPQESTLELLSAVFSRVGKRRQILGSMHPALKLPAEAVTGQDFYFGGDFGAYRKAPRALATMEKWANLGLADKITLPNGEVRYEISGGANAFVRATPFSQILTMTNKLLDGKRGAVSRLVNVFTGLQTKPVDVDKEFERKLARWLQSKAESGQVGEALIWFDRMDEASTPEELKIVMASYRGLQSEKRKERNAEKKQARIGGGLGF